MVLRTQLDHIFFEIFSLRFVEQKEVSNFMQPIDHGQSGEKNDNPNFTSS